MYLTDYHTHTPLCLHASGTVEEFAAAVIASGLKEYGIADHCPMPENPIGKRYDHWRMLQSDLAAYFEWIETARSILIPHGIEVKVGLECDWLPNITPWIQHLKTLYPWDYLIGSMHYLDNGWEFDHPENQHSDSPAGIDADWENYWLGYERMVRSGLFQIMGHCDLIRKWSRTPTGDLSRFYHPCIAAMGEMGSVMELNTSGWYYPSAEQYPSMEILRTALDCGVDVMVNSDAHVPSSIARDFARARQVLLDVGYTQTVSFNAGEKVYHPL